MHSPSHERRCQAVYLTGFHVCGTPKGLAEGTETPSVEASSAQGPQQSHLLGSAAELTVRNYYGETGPIRRVHLKKQEQGVPVTVQRKRIRRESMRTWWARSPSAQGAGDPALL